MSHSKSPNISVFFTNNDTRHWAVAVDGMFGLYATKADAQRVFDLTGGQEDDLGGTPFREVHLMPPGWSSRSSSDSLSAHTAVNIEQYIVQHMTWWRAMSVPFVYVPPATGVHCCPTSLPEEPAESAPRNESPIQVAYRMKARREQQLAAPAA